MSQAVPPKLVARSRSRRSSIPDDSSSSARVTRGAAGAGHGAGGDDLDRPSTVIVGETTATARRLTILRLAAVMARTGLARSTVYAYVAAGTFPEPIQLGSANAVGWIESEVNEWILAQVRATRGADWGRGIGGVSDKNSSSAA
jgi:prophage regulatory protein